MQPPKRTNWSSTKACRFAKPIKESARNIANRNVSPLLTAQVDAQLRAAAQSGAVTLKCSLDLGRSGAVVTIGSDRWVWNENSFPYPERCKLHTIYYWTGSQFEPVARYGTSLIKLVPTEWGPPTFEIDGIKMLPTAKVSPYDDARNKVALIEPRGKTILDTCGGLGYFAAWCIELGAKRVRSFEKNLDVLWLRELNPWSPRPNDVLSMTHGDIVAEIRELPSGSVDAVLHDPPRFAIAGELYAQSFYDELARVLKRGGRLFHYTGTPNRLARGRDLPREVAARLQNSGFTTKLWGDGVLAINGRGATHSNIGR